tara:strand:+ start:1059 stop:1166 length:108 start_codon:yes stop_codon:yes gene_type:complete
MEEEMVEGWAVHPGAEAAAEAREAEATAAARGAAE